MTKAYFFKNGKYHRHIMGGGPDNPDYYPRELSKWHPFLKDGVDAAVHWSFNMGDIYRYFRTGYTGHSYTNAYLLSLLSLYIYENRPFGGSTFENNFKFQFQTLSASNPFDIRQFDSNKKPDLPFAWAADSQAAVLTNSDMTLVVFRGTITGQDWWTDIKAAPAQPWDDGGIFDLSLVHAGFKFSLDVIYDQILARVSNNGNRPVFLTGHSLGGAMALLCAYRLRAVDGLNVRGVYTFAAPRPGNGHFRYKYDNLLGDRTYCWEYKNDPVPHFPPMDGTPMGPSHVGQLNRVMPDGKIIRDDDKPYLIVPPVIGVIPDHDMENYIRVMKKALSNKSRTAVNNPTYLVEGDAPDLI